MTQEQGRNGTTGSTVSVAGIGVERQYSDHLAAGRFMIQKCEACTRHVFPPRELCPHCDGDTLLWVAPGGRGTVFSYTTVSRKPDAGGNYNVSLIELDEGVRMMSTIVGLAPDGVRIGISVQASVERAEQGRGTDSASKLAQPVPPRVVFTEASK